MSAWINKNSHIGTSSTKATKEGKVRAYSANSYAILFALLELKEIEKLR